MMRDPTTSSAEFHYTVYARTFDLITIRTLFAYRHLRIDDYTAQDQLNHFAFSLVSAWAADKTVYEACASSSYGNLTQNLAQLRGDTFTIERALVLNIAPLDPSKLKREAETQSSPVLEIIAACKTSTELFAFKKSIPDQYPDLWEDEHARSAIEAMLEARCNDIIRRY